MRPANETQSAASSSSAPAGALSAESSRPSLLEQLVESNQVGQTSDSTENPLTQFASEVSTAARLKTWLGRVPIGEQQVADARMTLARDIATIDQLLASQVNAILHHPAFQTLESSWRGLHYLWKTRRRLSLNRGLENSSAEIQIRVLDVTKKELKRDFEKASDFDQNSLFHKVYEQEFGTAGGEPYGILIADYEFTNHPDDIDLLAELSEVGAASFAPVITSASPDLIGLDSFTDLEKPVNLERIFRQNRHRKWRTLRERVDSRFLGLTLPRVLMREPYQQQDGMLHGFRFEEDVRGQQRSKYLWGNAAWAMGGVVLRAFASCGWFADIRGVQRGIEGGGLVTGMPTHSFQTDAFGVVERSNVEVALSEFQENELCSLGFIPLSHCKDTPFSVFYSNQSVHEPVVTDDAVANSNAKISAMLQYVLCCSRIAHYLKIHTRNKLGSHMSPMEIQNHLQGWLVDYVTPDEKAPPAMKARFPLREADVEVQDIPGQPGSYMLTLRLLPHYQLDGLSSTMTLLSRRVDLKE